MKYKMVVSDFDGTLTSSTDNIISTGNIDAINGFISRGGVFTVCTGRCTTGIMPALEKANYQGYYASYNGAVIGDTKTGEIFYRNPITNDIILRFLKYVKNLNVTVHTYPNDELTVEKATEYTKWYLIYNKMPYKEIPSLYDYFLETGIDSCKLLIMGDKEVLDECLEGVANCIPECNVVRAKDFMVEINLKGVSKGAALIKLAQIANVKIEETIAVGDAGNDVAMLKTAGLGVAMENAPDYVKENAGYVTKHVDEDGIKYLIEQLCI